MSKRALKVAVAAALLAFLLWRADWAEAAVHFTRFSAQTLAVVLASLSLGLVLSAWKWLYALRIQRMSYPFSMLLRVLCAGFFFNAFLPTAIGGDAYRVYRTLPPDGYRTRAVTAVVIDRATGLLALLSLGGVAAIVLYDRSAAARLFVTVGLVLAVGCTISVAVARRGRWRKALLRWRHLPWVDALIHSIELLRNQRLNWLGLVSLSAVFQMISIGVVFALFREVDATVTLAQSALITALVGVAAVMPISIAGIGVMEGTLVGSAIALGLDYEVALVVAIERRLVALILSALCAVAYIADARRQNTSSDWPRLLQSLRKLRARPQGPEVDVPLERGAPSDPRGWHYSEILDYTNDAIIIWEMAGDGIVYWNRAAQQLYGYTRSEALGQITHTLLQTRLAGGVRHLETVLARYGVWVGTLHHTTREGRHVDVEARLALLSQRNGRWLVLEVNRDITHGSQMNGVQEVMEMQLADLRHRSRVSGR